jgi:hypothetical protein
MMLNSCETVCYGTLYILLYFVLLKSNYRPHIIFREVLF